jgi:hypothetical protein
VTWGSFLITKHAEKVLATLLQNSANKLALSVSDRD